LVYPIPVAGGLGVHFTLDLGKNGKFGPDVEWVETIGYEVDERRAENFYSSILKYWPRLDPGALSPSYAGIRPKLAGPASGDQDFLIQTEHVHSVPGLINFFGIESPGLTASLSIAESIAEELAA
jgi:L-2-hydroxyglutarate oxidase LhgO